MKNIILLSKMNGNFRKPEYVKRYEYTYFDLETPLNAIVANNARQTKDNYRFVVDNSSEANPIDWYNAYLEVDFQLVTLADSAVGIVAGANNGNQDCTTTNGNTFIKEIQVECNGTSVYTNMRANESSNALTPKIHEKLRRFCWARPILLYGHQHRNNRRSPSTSAV